MQSRSKMAGWVLGTKSRSYPHSKFGWNVRFTQNCGFRIKLLVDNNWAQIEIHDIKNFSETASTLRILFISESSGVSEIVGFIW